MSQLRMQTQVPGVRADLQQRLDPMVMNEIKRVRNTPPPPPSPCVISNYLSATTVRLLSLHFCCDSCQRKWWGLVRQKLSPGVVLCLVLDCHILLQHPSPGKVLINSISQLYPSPLLPPPSSAETTGTSTPPLSCRHPLLPRLNSTELNPSPLAMTAETELYPSPLFPLPSC